MSAFKQFVCWRAEETEHFVHREALEGDPAAFLAVHFPIRDFQLVIGKLPEASDEALLRVLADAHPHAITIIEGEPGSGKSHLVKWLQHRWPRHEHDKVVLVPRSDGSLSGALERLREELGRPYSDPLEGLGAASQLTRAGHTNQFIGNLVTTAQGSNYSKDKQPKLADWLDDRDAWRVLNHSALRERWRAPDDIVNVIKGADGNRDQAAAEFTPSHIADLVSTIRDAAERAVGSFKATRFFNDLEKEVPQVRDVVAANPNNLTKQLEGLAGVALNTRTFIEALNARIGDALQGTLGIQRGELQTKFLEVRKLLRKDSKRLVLLLEDITNLQGVDQQLIEALLPNPNVDVNRSLCELIAVIGVTPQYQSQVLEAVGNVQDRLSFHVRLTPIETRGIVGAQSLFLANEQRRQQFVASYLNAVRLGLNEVQEWEKEGSLTPRPNACEQCEHRNVCFSRFGSVVVQNVSTSEGDQVGLYPFTAHAIERFWSRLEHPGRVRSLKTPRGLLLNVVSGVLDDLRALEEGTFPSPKVDSPNLRQDGGNPDVVERCAQLGDKEGGRLARTIQTWGDLNDGRKKQGSAEGLTYSGIPQGVAFAFDLRWPDEVIEEPFLEPGGKGKGIKLPTPPTPPRPPISTPAENVLPSEWKDYIDDLNRWLGGKALRSVAAWEALLHEAVDALEPGPLGAPRGLWEVIMTRQNVAFAGAKERTTQLTFGIEANPATVRGLTALAWLKHGKNLTAKVRFQRLAEATGFQSFLASKAHRHVAACELQLSKDLGGQPADLAVKSLVLIAMLEEKVRPGTVPIEAWRSALRAGANPASGRCREWELLRNLLAPEREALAKNAVGLLQVGVGKLGAKLDGVVDGGKVLSAVQAALQLPDKWNTRQKEGLKRDAWATALQVADELRTRLTPAIVAEHKDISQRCQKLQAATDGKDAEQFLTIVAQVIEDCIKMSNEIISQQIQQKWRAAKMDLKNEKLDAKSERLRAVDDAIDKFDEEGKTDETRKQLELVLSVPKGDFGLVERAVTEGATGINEAYERVAEWMKRSKGKGDGTDEVSSAVKVLKEATKALKDAHRGGRR